MYNCLFFAVLEMEPRVLHLLNQVYPTELNLQPTFFFNVCGYMSDSVEACLLRHFTHANKCIHTHMHTLTCMQTPPSTCTHVCTDAQARTHVHTPTPTTPPPPQFRSLLLTCLLSIADFAFSHSLSSQAHPSFSDTPLPLQPMAASSSLFSELSPGALTPRRGTRASELSS